MFVTRHALTLRSKGQMSRSCGYYMRSKVKVMCLSYVMLAWLCISVSLLRLSSFYEWQGVSRGVHYISTWASSSIVTWPQHVLPFHLHFYGSREPGFTTVLLALLLHLLWERTFENNWHSILTSHVPFHDTQPTVSEHWRQLTTAKWHCWIIVAA